MKSHPPFLLGIETSCDETAAAVLSGDGKILSNKVLSQMKTHEAYGGVVPEIAARAHLDHLDHVIRMALTEAGLSFADLGVVAATTGPGLIGGVMVGMIAGKTIAAARKIPFIGINHLEGHVLTARLTDQIDFPYLVLLVSGGHTQLLVAEDVGLYRLLGATLDDALGECFDKSAKMMGLPYPGGPNLERLALECKSFDSACEKYPLPRPMKGREGFDFSFSGLKTAVRLHLDALPADQDLIRADMAQLAAAFQQAVAEILNDRCARAMDYFAQTYPQAFRGYRTPAFVVCGGVAANQVIRAHLNNLATGKKMDFIAPPLALCSDNAAMIAWAGWERLKRGMTTPLDCIARPRWPLESLTT